MGPPWSPMLLASLLGLLRPALPLILGLSLGCSLSLLHVSWIQGETEDPCVGEVRKFQSLRSRESVPETEDMRPIILPYSRNPKASHKKVLRTRYIQSELGFRERLCVVVLSARSSLNTFGVAVNRTVSPYVRRLIFFTGAHGPKLPQGMEVVTHKDERPAWLMYHTLRHIETHLLSTYDWFYVTQDDSYTNGYRLRELAAHLSPGAPSYVGQPMEFIGGEEGWRYCHGGSGYLLSRSLLLSLGPHLDFCRSDILSAQSDKWLGRCLQDTLGISCVGEVQGQRILSVELPRNADVDALDELLLSGALSVHPVREAALTYRLQRRLSKIQLQKTYGRIRQLQDEIRNLSSLTPEGGDQLSWPVGINPPFISTSRFDLLTWEYFTESHAFSCPDGSPKCPLQGVWLQDVRQVLEEAVDCLNTRYNPWLHFRLHHLLNGYRRFDPTRGMEYILDLLLEATTERGNVATLAKRISLLRPLGHVEILPMPYVTEATRVQLVLPLMPSDAENVAGFLDAFATNILDPRENVGLTVVMAYDMGSMGQNEDIFQEVRAMVSELEKRYSPLQVELVSVSIELASQIMLMGVVSKKHPVDTLFFLVGVQSEVTTEVLNRCRMNAISAWQVFSPVHYQEYSPDVLRHMFPSGFSTETRREGHFDHHASSEFCFYNSDFMAAHRKMASHVHDDEDGGEMELLELFLQFSELHIFRALEPALVQRFSLQKCSARLSGDGYHRCVLSKLEALGSRTHLAMALFEQEQTNST